LEIEHYPKNIDLSPYIEAWVDSVEQRDFQQAQSNRLPSVPLESLDIPLPLEHELWGRFFLVNLLQDTLELVFATGLSDYVEVYIVSGERVQLKKTGYYTSPIERDIKIGTDEAVAFQAPPQDTLALYFHMKEKEGWGPQPAPYLTTQESFFYDFYRNTYWGNIFIFLFQGAALMLMMYNLLVYFHIKDRIYIYYALYLLCIALYGHFEIVVGRIPFLGFPQQPWNYLTKLLTFNLISVFYLQFGRSLLNTCQNHPTWDRILKAIIKIRISLIVFGIAITLIRDEFFRLSDIGAVLYGLETLILVPFFVTLLRTKSVLARYFIVGSILVFGLAFFQIFLSSIIGMGMNPFYTIVASLSLEILVFALALGYKMRLQQQEKLETEQSLNRELTKINTAFGRFVPHEFIQNLGHESVVDVKLGDQVEKEVTVLFSDIRGYTSLAEGMTPAENFRFLNAYLGRVGPIIQQYGGFVNQYYGDGVMALFLKGPENALAAAEAMQQTVRAYNSQRSSKERAPIRIGIGMHTGSLMMGIIGDTLRMEASVVSDTVNTSSRMEGLTKYFGVNIVLSETVEEALTAVQKQHLRYLGRVLVKGRRQPTHIYESLQGYDRTIQARIQTQKEPFEQALTAYFKGDFAEALRLLDTVAEALPQDQAVQYYRQLASQYLEHDPDETWLGYEVMLDK